jgi:hypothetical protein
MNYRGVDHIFIDTNDFNQKIEQANYIARIAGYKKSSEDLKILLS